MPALLDENRALELLLDLLRIDGLSGQESRISAHVTAILREAGCPPDAIRRDTAAHRLGDGFETGNLIVRLPGTFRSRRLLFSAHLDTVPLCRGADPVVRGRRVVPRGSTALGGDDRSGVAALVSALEHILRERLAHPPLTFLFTIAEEVGLRGSRHVRVSDLGRPSIGFNVDSGAPSELIIGATGADRWDVTVHGIASHAGVHPEDGVSAALIASRAISTAAADGWFGRVEKGRSRGTSNVGVLKGGETTNQVLDRLEIRGECRSHDLRFLDRLTNAWRRSFERAARGTRNTKRQQGAVDFRSRRDYEPFRLEPDSEPVRRATAAVESLSLEPRLRVADGGLDASWLTAKGIPTVTLGAGQHHAHTVREHVDIPEYLDGCRLVLALAVSR